MRKNRQRNGELRTKKKLILKDPSQYSVWLFAKGFNDLGPFEFLLACWLFSTKCLHPLLTAGLARLHHSPEIPTSAGAEESICKSQFVLFYQE